MCRIDFGLCFFENVEELRLSVFLYVWPQACVCSLYLCVHSSVLAYTGMFLRFCIRGNRLAYAGSCLRVWTLTCVHKTPCKSSTLPIFTSFSTISPPYAILTPFFVILASEKSLYHSFYLHSCIKTPYPLISLES